MMICLALKCGTHRLMGTLSVSRGSIYRHCSFSPRISLFNYSAVQPLFKLIDNQHYIYTLSSLSTKYKRLTIWQLGKNDFEYLGRLL